MSVCAHGKTNHKLKAFIGNPRAFACVRFVRSHVHINLLMCARAHSDQSLFLCSSPAPAHTARRREEGTRGASAALSKLFEFVCFCRWETDGEKSGGGRAGRAVDGAVVYNATVHKHYIHV